MNKGPLVDTKKLDFFLLRELNILFTGKHGIGKTHIAQDAFKRNGLKAMYLSGSTLDPWVDVVGIPQIVEDEHGHKYSDIIPPKRFALGEVEALFIDELNRSPKKVRNAVMELIQFKSINGKPYPNLKVVWAAINPYDPDKVDYDVEPLDPAMEDRFHVKLELDYRPCPQYMMTTYAKEYANPALKWWGELPAAVQELVSPRRLCYALDHFLANGDLRDILPHESNPNKLAKDLGDAPIFSRVATLFRNNDVEGLKTALQDPNFYASLVPHLVDSDRSARFILPHVTKEQRMSLVTEGTVMEVMVTYAHEEPAFVETLQAFLNHKGNENEVNHLVMLIKRFNKESLFTLPETK
ncbi:MAG: hypothetical protein JSS66_05520 [Armatimonadetes bacterium]|nr:hypothetical protein [Armatimonadota bacterium]